MLRFRMEGKQMTQAGIGRRGVVLRSVAVVVRGDEVLLVESNSTPGAWVPPGGKVEPGEPLALAAEREVLEETGVEVRVGALLGLRQVWAEGRDALEVYLAASAAEGSPEAGTGIEGRPARWVRVTDLGSMKHFPPELPELCTRVAGGPSEAWLMVPRDLRGDAR